MRGEGWKVKNSKGRSGIRPKSRLHEMKLTADKVIVVVKVVISTRFT